MPTFEVHYEQDKQVHKELVEAETAEEAWKVFVANNKDEHRPVLCVIRHSIG